MIACYSEFLSAGKTINMKIIVSSKQLAADLSLIDFDNDHVVEVGADENELIIDTQEGTTVRIGCEMSQRTMIIKQENRRWDWVKRLVENVEEQPIVLDISENIINVIFQY